MPIDLTVTTVPPQYQLMVNRLRVYLNDTVEQNDLLGDIESSDLELYIALQETLDEVSYSYGPHDMIFNTLEEVPWVLLRQGATLTILEMKSIRSARNTLTYNDSGGISVKENDVYGRYVVWYNTLLNDYRRKVTSWKRAKNMEGSWGGSHSEYSDYTW